MLNVELAAHITFICFRQFLLKIIVLFIDYCCMFLKKQEMTIKSDHKTILTVLIFFPQLLQKIVFFFNLISKCLNGKIEKNK